MIRVLITDDHLVVREGLQLILSMEEDMAVVGEAVDGETAVRLAGELQPDVVLMDLRMPGMGGLEAISRILAEWPDMAIVILTTYNEDDLMLRGLQAGARGFLLKDTGRQTLFNTIRAAARGETLMQPEILLRVLAHTGGGFQSTTKPMPAPGEEGGLTEREMEVLTAVARGERNKEIALALGVTERTVKAHLTNVYNKLGVDSRAGAVSAAIQRGLLAG
ncbi:MAG: response regulator transcription factor [Chloroflexi bacterium]|nr:response regulator transcription factor [Chloroflexota bacterium]MBP7041974.1 response regulator transcription factor [Chloroflexota bacterium]